MAHNIPDPNVVFPNAYKTSCFLKNVVQAPNVTIGDYTYYDDPQDPTGFEKNNILFNYPEFGDRLTIGKFCCLASGATFIMGAANHRLCSVTTYPFAVFGGAWEENAPSHLDQLPRKGDTVGGNPARFLKNRFDSQLTQLLLEAQWWDWEPQALAQAVPMLCSPDLEAVKSWLRGLGYGAACT